MKNQPICIHYAGLLPLVARKVQSSPSSEFLLRHPEEVRIFVDHQEWQPDQGLIPLKSGGTGIALTQNIT